NQVFITAAERAAADEGFEQTANAKVVMYYEEDFFDKMTWVDGSPYTLADFVMFMILSFDPAKEASAIYDEAQVSAFETFMGAFKGWVITSEDPLIIEYYTDAFQLDAENNVTNFRAASPSAMANGEAPWHSMALGIQVEAAGEAAFSADKAEVLEVEWMSYIAGPTLDLLKGQLDAAEADSLIPYAATLGQYTSAEEAAARYANIQEFYRRNGHFWVTSGPFFLQKAFPVEGTIILQRNPEYPDLASRWSQFSSAPIPSVELDGTDRVGIGEEATFDVFVTLDGADYAVDEISLVKYLVFDATGALAFVGEADAMTDGHWTVTLTADMTSALAAGSNQLVVIVVSKRALVPVNVEFQFVTQ
ncbi:MAG: ABC transporter substrate-binding protein, partial [Chloroflexota bacterium]